jgi:FkbM family methyltransferase
VNTRGEITAPLTDALFDETEVLRKELVDGTVFEFRYKPWIVRDFLLSFPRTPDHVWEPQTTKLLRYLASDRIQRTVPGDVVVGGAYFGDHAILLAKEIAARGSVCHAFEPSQEQSAMLARNAALNALSNIRIERKGLWNEANVTLSFVGDDALASSQEALEPTSAESFITTTVDDYLREQNVQSLQLLMIDVEGAELKTLQGAESQLALPANDAPSIVFEVHRHYVDWSDGLANTEILRYLASFGYSCFAVRDFHSNIDMSGKPIEIIPPEAVYLEGPPHGFNMVAVKQAAYLQAPMFKVVHGVSPKLIAHKESNLHHPLDGL